MHFLDLIIGVSEVLSIFLIKEFGGKKDISVILRLFYYNILQINVDYPSENLRN